MCTITKYIKRDGTYDLHNALQDECKDKVGTYQYQQAVSFIERTEELVPMNKLTIAAHTLTSAINIARSKA